MNLLAGCACVWAAIAPFTERGQTDFDTFLGLLDPYGSWTQAAPTDWRYAPLAAAGAVPFTRGQWVYSDYGWTWKGSAPESWATEHYGWWALDGKWQWHPDPYWHAAPVDFRISGDHIGWRPSRLDEVNEFLEKDQDRYAKPEEWVWVPKAKFAQPLAPGDLLVGAAAKDLLADSRSLTHVITIWRSIERPGPSPVETLPRELVVAPDELKENQSPVKSLQVFSLPTFWTPPPEKPEPNALYVYRPQIYQDADGIERRVQKWHHPEISAQEQEEINKALKK